MPPLWVYRLIDAAHRAYQIAWPRAEVKMLRKQVETMQEAFANPELTGVNLDRGMVDIGLRGSAAQMLAGAFVAQFEREGATNYLQVHFEHVRLGPFTVTLQRVHGKTPTQRVKELEEDVAEGRRVAWDLLHLDDDGSEQTARDHEAAWAALRQWQERTNGGKA